MMAAMNTGTLGFLLGVFGLAFCIWVIGFGYEWIKLKNVSQGLSKSVPLLLVEFAGAILFLVIVYPTFVMRTVYYTHTGFQYQVQLLSQENGHKVDPSSRDIIIAGLTQRLSETQAQLESRKQTLHDDDPSFQNMTKTIRAFMTWRQNIGYGAPCKMLITSPDGDDNMYMTFITMAVFGSNCGNGDLNNVGVKPQNIETETAKGMIPGVIVFHALPDAKGANQLETELANLFQVKRSYAIPGDAPPDAIWLQFGTGVEWNTEKFAKKR
ncbi:MAG TPA: hypothetical protein VHW70_09010 [Edaphobacter sp.]|jgi:hypothetical protein|nr:hypothetical protein [Edaphobacter sp.]